MNCKSCACGNNPNHQFVPPRGPWDELKALGVRRTCVSTPHAVQVACPENWSVQPTEVSPFHAHLCDETGKPVACLFTKPGSGGAGTFQMTSQENCAAVNNKN